MLHECTSFSDIESTIEFEFETAKVGFAMELKKVMDENRMSNAQLATKMKVSRPMVTKLLRGDANVTIETMVKASIALGGKISLKIKSETPAIKLLNTVMARSSQRAAHRMRCIPGVLQREGWSGVIDLKRKNDEAKPLAA